MNRVPGGSSKNGKPLIGLVEWFSPGQFERAESVLSILQALGVEELRTAVSWADWHTSEGDGWYAWLLPKLAKQANIVPCFLYTPPSLGVVPKFSSPPLRPKDYGDFLDVMITRFGHLFEWLELWNRPDDLNEWDARLDPEWRIFSETIGGAAYWARQRGKKTVLPALWPRDPQWLELMRQRGVLQYVDAVGMHGYPRSPEFAWKGWAHEARETQEWLARAGLAPELWITDTGSSTWRDTERGQAEAFVDAAGAPVRRVYWREAQDRSRPATDSLHSDEREYHYGLTRADGSPKLLYSLWSKGGDAAVRRSVQESSRPAGPGRSKRHVLITGGAGFIGTNLADRLLDAGRQVVVYDDLSRPGAERNVSWLRQKHGEALRVEMADVRNRQSLRQAVRGADGVFHFAAQVAVTTSLTNPLHDFEVNVGGTLNLLEELRSITNPPPLLFTSTNKVYGHLADLQLEKNHTRYLPLDKTLRGGVSEARPLDFHSPYGCSKGAADQYVLDYARTFGLPAVVFRMSCIYGLHQMGTEDQGWVAHFLIRALAGKPIVLYGDGLQVRDLLYIDDLVDAFLLAHGNIHSVSGQAFNIGGGLGNTISLIELLEMIGALHGSKPEVRFSDWRCGDQRYYVSDTTKFKAATGWSPKVSAPEGVKKLYHWLQSSRQAAPRVLSMSGGGYAILPS